MSNLEHRPHSQSKITFLPLISLSSEILSKINSERPLFLINKRKMDDNRLNFNLFPKPQGDEGRMILQEIEEIRKDEPIQRLIQKLENDSNKRHQGLYDYLNSLRSEAGNEFTESVLDISWQVWEKLKDYFQSINLCLEVPDACVGYQDNLMFTWSKGEHYLECEIFGNGELEFFYRNRNSNVVWGEDITLGHEFSNDLLNKLLLFTW